MVVATKLRPLFHTKGSCGSCVGPLIVVEDCRTSQALPALLSLKAACLCCCALCTMLMALDAADFSPRFEVKVLACPQSVASSAKSDVELPSDFQVRGQDRSGVVQL